MSNEYTLILYKYNSTIGASFAPVELTQAPISTCLKRSDELVGYTDLGCVNEDFRVVNFMKVNPSFLG